jgi:quercetin dioxygenase-like cupin family protein
VKSHLVLPGLDEPPVERGGGVRTWYLVTAERGATEFLTGITEFDPGASLARQFHNCQESVTVLEGRAIFEADGEEYEMGHNASTLVPTGIVHRFRNLGPGRLRILFVYGSANATRTLVPEAG